MGGDCTPKNDLSSVHVQSYMKTNEPSYTGVGSRATDVLQVDGNNECDVPHSSTQHSLGVDLVPQPVAAQQGGCLGPSGVLGP